MKTFSVCALIMGWLCVGLGVVAPWVGRVSAADDAQLRFSKLTARVAVLEEQVKQLKIACGEDRLIKEYVWQNNVGEFRCRSCQLMEEPR